MKQAAGSSAILITVLPAVFDRNLLLLLACPYSTVSLMNLVVFQI